ncbi:MAG: acetyl esterase/lipase [Candidatus Azotimanducaceae bacterium]|jgi:acetyl esterase/lipase
MSNAYQPGRLGNPDMTIQTDPRTDPRIAAAFEMAASIPSPDAPDAKIATVQDGLDYCAGFEQASALMHPAMEAAMPVFDDVSSSVETIKGVDGNDIILYVHTPKQATQPGPCIVHTHGGGMVLMTAADPAFIRWRNDLAHAGLRVVGVEFRNGGGSLGDHPFPAGLNDCASAVNWTWANRERLGISSIVISGESGGGNLAIATTLKAKQEGWLEQIDGVYACCPYISGSYLNPPEELGSLVENNGYSMDCNMMAVLVRVYDPTRENANNPLAWPYQCSAEDLKGLPPHVISVNELDPLRDEGLVFYRRLMAAGVSAMARTVHGTSHAGDLVFPDLTPELYNETLRSLHQFAHSLE